VPFEGTYIDISLQRYNVKKVVIKVLLTFLALRFVYAGVGRGMGVWSFMRIFAFDILLKFILYFNILPQKIEIEN
jgi:hypothetical protein